MHVITDISHADLLHLSRQNIQYFCDLMSSLSYNTVLFANNAYSFKK